jgi:hypothetical protein
MFKIPTPELRDERKRERGMRKPENMKNQKTQA